MVDMRSRISCALRGPTARSKASRAKSSGAPLAHVFAGQQVLLELSQNLVLDFDRKVLELGDSVSYFLDFDVGEEFHDLGGGVAAERDHEDGDLLSRRQLLGSELAPTLGNFVNVLHCSPRPL